MTPRHPRRKRDQALHTTWCSLGSMLVRKQIVVSPAIDARIRRLARARRISQSRLISDAVEAFGGAEDQPSGVLAFAGTIKHAPGKLSKEVDKSLYS